MVRTVAYMTGRKISARYINLLLTFADRPPMKAEDALAFLEEYLPQTHLNKLQSSIFLQVWEDRSYREIAQDSGYGLSHIKQTGSELWQLLSQAFGEKVSKTNIHSVLKRHARGDRVPIPPPKISQSPPWEIPLSATNSTHAAITPAMTPFCDWGEAADVPTFLGRTEEMATLKHWILGTDPTGKTAASPCRLIGLFGMGGMGKTTLSIQLAQQFGERGGVDSPHPTISSSHHSIIPLSHTTIHLRPAFDSSLTPKSASSVRLIAHPKVCVPQFHFIIWRSLRNAPPPAALLTDLIQVLAQEPPLVLPETVEEQIRVLVDHLKQKRCLLILDNFEAILRPQDSIGGYRPGYEGYGELLAAIGEIPHQSCLLFTSREKPAGFLAREGQGLPVRSLQLTGLSPVAVQNLLRLRGQFFATEDDWQELINHYSGNPLALKIAAGAIADFFNGNVSQFLRFLEKSGCIFADIRDLLDSQFQRLTPLEQHILYWLAIHREPVSLVNLQSDFIPKPQSSALLEALVSLERRCFLERTTPGDRASTQQTPLFTLQPVVLEYVTEQLIETVYHDIVECCWGNPSGTPQLPPVHPLAQPLLLKTHALLKATTKDYLRDIQGRLILQPLAERLLNVADLHDLDQRLMQLLSYFRGRGRAQTGYLAGNVINLLCQLQVNLSNRDFSFLTILQAHLKRVTLHRVNFTGADLSQSVFTESFSPVLSVSLSPDGSLLAAGDVNHEIHVWQVGTQQPLLTLEAEGWVWSVAFSPSGRLLASSANRLVCLWDVQTGQCVRSLQGYASRIFSIAFSTDGKYLISGSEDHLIRIWDVETGELLHCLDGHTDEVRSIAVHSHGHWFASAGCDRTIRLWDLNSRVCLGQTDVQASVIESIAFSADGTQLIASGDHTVQRWRINAHQLPADTPTETPLNKATQIQALPIAQHPSSPVLSLQQSLHGHTAPVRAVACCPVGDCFASGSDDHTIRIWSLKTGECLRTLYSHTSWISSICFAASGNKYLLASGSEDQSIRLWDSRTAVCLQSLQGYSNGIWSIACHPDGQQFVSGGQDRTVRLWNSTTGECLQIMRGHQSWVWSVVFNPDGNLLASSSDDRTIRIWNTGGQCLQVLQGHTDQVYSIAFSPSSCWLSNSLLASGSLDGTIRLWNAQTGMGLQTIRGHQGGVWSVAFNPAGTLLASGSLDQTIKLWDMGTLFPDNSDSPPRLLKTLTGHRSWVRTVAFHPNGHLLASASADGVLKLWDVTTGALLKTVQAHNSTILCVVFSPDGETLATSGIDGTVRIWPLNTKYNDSINVKKHQLNRNYELSRDDELKNSAIAPDSIICPEWKPQILTGHERWVRFLAYHSAESVLMSCSQDETIKFWHLPTGKCQKTIRILRPYEGMIIQGIRGLTTAQTQMLRLLGAIGVDDFPDEQTTAHRQVA